MEVAHELVALIASAVEQARGANVAEREPWMTVADAAKYAATSEDTIRQWIASSRLAAGRAGKEWRVRASDIDAMFMASSVAVPKQTTKRPSTRALELLAELGDDAEEDGRHG